MVRVPRIGVLVSRRAEGVITLGTRRGKGMAALITLRRGVPRAAGSRLGLDALAVGEREGGPGFRILDDCTVRTARVVGVPLRGIRSRVCSGVRAVICVPAVQSAHRHPGGSGVAALNIRHGCQVEPVRIPPTIAPGAPCIWTIGQPAPKGSRALRPVTIKPVVGDATSSA
jgi:hypothetical protein